MQLIVAPRPPWKQQRMKRQIRVTCASGIANLPPTGMKLCRSAMADLAAMVFGGVASERIQLNEDTIWAGEKRDRNNPEGARNLAEVRRLLFAGKPKEAEQLAERTMISVPKRMPPYQPLGDLFLRFDGHENAREYVRELDLDSGIVRISYRIGRHSLHA